jgi:hypothetical protein
MILRHAYQRHYGHVAGAISDDDVREYMRTYRESTTTRMGLAYYRTIERDVAVMLLIMQHS